MGYSHVPGMVGITEKFGRLVKILLFANTDWYLYNYRMPLVQTLLKEGHEVVLLSPPGLYAKRFQAAKLKWIPFKLSRRGVNPFAEISSILRLMNLYRCENPDIVHHFTIKCILFGSLAAWLAGIKKVVNAVTGLGYVFTRRDAFTVMAKPIIQRLFQLALRGSQVIFQNQHDMDYFILKRIAKPQQCVLIPGSGVDIERFKPRPIPKGNALVVLPARMLWEKGIGEFVEAARLVKKTLKKTRFALVGTPDEGNPMSIPDETLKGWAESGMIEWWGWQDDMVDVYQQASVVCLPSYYGEGLAKSLIEAAACGRPLVASDIPGCREVVENGMNGFLVAPRNAPALAKALVKLIINPELRRVMGMRSREIVTEKFSSKIINSLTLTLYKKV
jgi:glycosyltransferase involved in cell wall biosynthesis